MSQTNPIGKNYIQGDVLTATPQKLQLLLVEAAMKNIHRTLKYWEENNHDAAFDSLTRAQDIVTEILCSFDTKGSPDIAKQFASIYVFIFRCLTDASMTHNPEKLHDALRVLTSERETWRLVCEKFGSSTTDTAASGTVSLTQSSSSSSPSNSVTGSPPPSRSVKSAAGPAKTGMSWDA